MKFNPKTVMCDFEDVPIVRSVAMIGGQQIATHHTLRTLVMEVLKVDTQQGVDANTKRFRYIIGRKFGRAKGDDIVLTSKEIAEILEVADKSAIPFAYGTLVAYLDPDQFEDSAAVPENCAVIDPDPMSPSTKAEHLVEAGPARPNKES